MHTSPPTPPQLPPAFIPLYFISLWLFISFLMSQFGWRSFSNRYPAPPRPQGTAYNSPSSWFGSFGHYHNAVRVVFTDAGVYCYMVFLFRLFHPPFLVPWESVKRIEKKQNFWGNHYWLEIKNDAGSLRLRLPEKIAPDLSRYHKQP